MKFIYPLSIALFTVVACNQPATSDTDDDTDITDLRETQTTSEPENDAPENYEKGGLKIYPFTGSPAYETASLKINAPKNEAVISGKNVRFDFAVENYQLGSLTEGAGSNGLANSDQGQHIHLILDNEPYSAHYESKFTKEVEPGHHIAIAFLSRSFHESVKNENAFKVFQFSAGDPKNDYQKADLKKPLLFYSRPKGEYKGKDARKLLFDFYLVNAELKPDGYSVIATINDSLKFEFDTWQPYIIEGLPMGENTISIQLVDANGLAVDSPVNAVTRKFMLSE